MKQIISNFLVFLAKKINPNTVFLHKTGIIKLNINSEEIPEESLETLKEESTSLQIEKSIEELKDTSEIPFINYDDIEENILPLVRTINLMPGLYTTESCGGHKYPIGSQASEDNWFIFFKINSNIKEGFSSLSYLTYYFNTLLFSLGLDVKLDVFCRATNNIDPISSFLVRIKGNTSDLIYINEMLLDLIKFDFDIESLQQAIMQNNISLNA